MLSSLQLSTKAAPVDQKLTAMNLSSPVIVPAQRRDRARSSPNVEAMLRRPPFPSHRFVGANPVQTMSINLLSLVTHLREMKP